MYSELRLSAAYNFYKMLQTLDPATCVVIGDTGFYPIR